MSTDPTEFVEGEVSGGDSDESDSGGSADGDTEVQATDETGDANPDGTESSVSE